MILNYKGKALCNVELQTPTFEAMQKDGFMWKVSTLPDRKYGSKWEICNTLQMFAIISRWTEMVDFLDSRG